MTAETVAKIGNMPVSLDLIGPGAVVFQQLIHYARKGYTITPGTEVQVYPNGNVAAFLIVGSPTAEIVASAEQGIADAIQQQEQQYKRDVAAAAAAAVDAYKAEQAQAKIAAEIKEHEKRIAALQASAKK